ncbi:hypothetical protein I4I73_10720 [Pseudonocardia sp. KRD-184]|uniref:Uncharacterized protein n=1 Tax=Pseudonocardia oceani TaxID=2792013 RepID=A0ABS6U835_9PSEU|nr:hypothetical protein [Pseudonocardia oceani]MBW0089454.1 hypothetical protein [Pseudonocardia oceani]MBW0096460.1 hypothetical protein [Pseudonocardia oceani]MBW0109154.1 hypothetical protein [Pseudonocardia oceani]MBW0120693.1 hypothetical protein [Pseudonocardia oceani]MBW0128373.1 hypothetical protein [Pseudonocardia oceani]
MTADAPAGPNFVPLRYRGVAVSTVPREVGLDAESLRAHFLGRDAYRRTRFVVARHDPAEPGPTAVLQVERASPEPLFSPVVDVRMVAGPDECAYVVDPDVDTGIPTALAAAAREHAPGARVVVVEGRYAHVNFILEPAPLRVVVRDVVPPEPGKLADQAARVVAVLEDLAPVELVARSVRLADLAASAPAPHYLLPCRGSGGEVPGAQVSYLDEHPEHADWTLLGCARSRQIHRHFYGEDPPTVDFCPKAGLPGTRPPEPVLTKCCLQEEHVESGDGWTSVPWGASLEMVRTALQGLVEREAPTWRPG